MADGLMGEVSRQHRIQDNGGEVKRNKLIRKKYKTFKIFEMNEDG